MRARKNYVQMKNPFHVANALLILSDSEDLFRRYVDTQHDINSMLAAQLQNFHRTQTNASHIPTMGRSHFLVINVTYCALMSY